jgi:hypothetical protein
VQCSELSETFVTDVQNRLPKAARFKGPEQIQQVADPQSKFNRSQTPDVFQENFDDSTVTV